MLDWVLVMMIAGANQSFTVQHVFTTKDRCEEARVEIQQALVFPYRTVFSRCIKQ